jgi:hypothetical protein
MPITTKNRRTRITAICKFTHEAKNLLEFTSNIPWLKFTENVTRHNVDMMIAISWWPTPRYKHKPASTLIYKLI